MHSHILLKASLDISNPLLTNIIFGKSFLIEWIRFNTMKMISEPIMHKFETEKNSKTNPGGISIHTYPETNTIYADIFSCKELDKEKNIEFIKRYGTKDLDIELVFRY